MPVNDRLVAMGEFAASRHGAITTSQAASFGLDGSTIRQLLTDGQLSNPTPGVFTLTSMPRTWRQELKVATLASNQAGIVDARAAGALHGVDCLLEQGVALLLAAPRKIQIPAIEVHVGPREPIDVTEIDSIPCVTLERAMCDLASVATPFQVKASFEWYWRTKHDLTPLAATATRLHRPGQSGTKKILALLGDAPRRGVPTESTLEVELEMAIDGIVGLIRQFEVFGPDGRLLGRVDFAVPKAKLAIEAHSMQWHSGPDQIRRDLERHRRLAADGWRIRYVTKDDLRDPAAVRFDIERLLRTGAQPRGYAPPPR